MSCTTGSDFHLQEGWLVSEQVKVVSSSGEGTRSVNPGPQAKGSGVAITWVLAAAGCVEAAFLPRNARLQSFSPTCAPTCQVVQLRRQLLERAPFYLGSL